MTTTKPTTDDLVGWLKLQSAPGAETRAVYDRVVAGAVSYIESRINLPVGTTDNLYPDDVALAILMTAARFAKRSTSPEGVAGLSDLGAVIRIQAKDPDVEVLLLRYLKLGFC